MSGPRISIGRINVSGVDATTAQRLGPAIEQALGAAAQQGEAVGGKRAGGVRVTLPEGAGSAEIAKAVAEAMARLRR